mmetsp:Transcript_23827/g.39393  ORF Transcript_23827/g.39393 Transcript_23827/m.39393 type:complete len:306 (+) Transcript_23827:64-981(+)|eukprot:CAMPEP_0119317674 /NCGR_PEP_ID=MMETSP1333-20130426/43838_1 /TAXON_ID=418940 /ORGANISM="Scyphosphaera apsteinii, Strain RCC1455" /LENGTH=305 /DNA_ID=CAMNT_0007323673 /DNA_START=64 /DNA_END=981 /DNA_ORIENTATION=+
MPAADYEKLGVVGEGTFGVVTRARKQSNGKLMAIKKIRSGALKNGTDLATLREVMLLQELRNDNVIEMSEVYCHNGNLNLVFEFCETDLERVIKDKSIPLDAARIKGYMQGTLRGLSYCHSNWVLHRDLKPGNLLLTARGQIKLADFGLARFFGSPNRKFTGQVVTRWYRPPELLFGAKFYGTAIDLWSVGCIFAELMRRVPLFPGTSDIDQLSRIFTDLGTPDDSTWPGLKSLPNYVDFQRVPGKPLSTMFSAASPEAISLLSRLLTYSPGARVAADEALASAYFKESPKPAELADLIPRVRTD